MSRSKPSTVTAIALLVVSGIVVTGCSTAPGENAASIESYCTTLDEEMGAYQGLIRELSDRAAAGESVGVSERSRLRADLSDLATRVSNTAFFFAAFLNDREDWPFGSSSLLGLSQAANLESENYSGPPSSGEGAALSAYAEYLLLTIQVKSDCEEYGVPMLQMAEFSEGL
jgi:hypothetical protein